MTAPRLCNFRFSRYLLLSNASMHIIADDYMVVEESKTSWLPCPNFYVEMLMFMNRKIFRMGEDVWVLPEEDVVRPMFRIKVRMICIRRRHRE